MKTNVGSITFVLALLGALATAKAQPVVSYSVSGSSGNYTLNFTVNNTTPGTQNQDIYFFGLYDPNATISGTPLGYALYGGYSPYGSDGAGSPTPLTYNNAWIDQSYTYLPTGSTLSGFDLLDTSLTAPTSLDYFAYGYDFGADYTGPDNLDPRDGGFNPLFEGATSVPEPTTLTLAGLGGLAALVAVRRRK